MSKAPRRARIFALANQKGGVGKTTTAVNLASYLAAMGRRVLLVDADPQANATSSLGFDKNEIETSLYDVLVNEQPATEAILPTGRPEFDLLPSAPALAGAEVELVDMPDREQRITRAIAPIAGTYNYVIIDLPPSLSLLTINALTAADGVVIPIQCEYLALEGLIQLVNTIKLVVANLNPRLKISGIVMTMYDSRNNLAAQVVEEVKAHYPEEVFASLIPRNVRIGEAPSYGQTIREYDPNSRGAQAYKALAEEFAARIESSNGG